MLDKLVSLAERKLVFKKHTTKFKAGDVAPAIEGLTQDGKPFDSNSLKGKKVVLFFYPKDNTPGCTAEACNLRDNYPALKKAGYTIVGVSADSVKKHQSFATKYSLPFPLIADPEMQLIKAFDVWGEKQFMGRLFDGILRTTFVIDEQGIITQVIADVATSDHTAQILK
jgi:thioredoxin-dependent peroxiredoxin